MFSDFLIAREKTPEFQTSTPEYPLKRPLN